MFINYEYENQIYNVSVEKRDNYYYITYDNTEFKVEAEEIEKGRLKIKLGDKLIKSIVTKYFKMLHVFIDNKVTMTINFFWCFILAMFIMLFLTFRKRNFCLSMVIKF